MVSAAEILKGQILIVDDQRPMVVLLQRILHSGGFVNVSTTTDPSLVCDLQREHGYHLILLDIEMPEINGFQVLAELMKSVPDNMPPVIVITAHQGQKLQAFQAGARDFIGKPFELPEVLARVKNMLEIRLLQLETQSYIKGLEERVRDVEHQITGHFR
jgi:DNA-binding response OmpR family regulator